MSIKPILFNTDMVRALLDGRKAATRRVVKFKYPHEAGSVKIGKSVQQGAAPELISYNPSGRPTTVYTAPYQPGDVLFARETWREYNGKYYYKANECPDYDDYVTKKLPSAPKWHPSIHMPREAARIWLRVTNVRVERLQDITVNDLQSEGIVPVGYLSQYAVMTEADGWLDHFKALWDSTIKPTDREKYGWDANPWVWTIEFERCERPEGWPT